MGFLLTGVLFGSAHAAVSVVDPYFSIGGFAQWYEVGEGDAFDVNHQAYFRRAHLYLFGYFNPSWSYKVEYDFALGGNWQNIWVNYERDNNDFKLGQFKVPFNSIFNQSSRFNWFDEWALPVKAFNPGFRRGAGYYVAHDGWGISASVFAPGTQTQYKVEAPYGSTQRLFYVPIHSPGKVLQLGISNWYQKTGAADSVNFGSIPEASGYHTVKTVSTGSIASVDDYNVSTLEGLFQYQRVASQLGFIYSHVPREAGGALNFYGAYGQVSYFLTDNTLDYRFMQGAFAGPANKQQAYQAVFRLSRLNLNDREIQGGKEWDATAGLNIYFLNRLKLGLNYIYANVSQSVTTSNGHDDILLANLQFMI